MYTGNQRFGDQKWGAVCFQKGEYVDSGSCFSDVRINFWSESETIGTSASKVGVIGASHITLRIRNWWSFESGFHTLETFSTKWKKDIIARLTAFLTKFESSKHPPIRTASIHAKKRRHFFHFDWITWLMRQYALSTRPGFDQINCVYQEARKNTYRYASSLNHHLAVGEVERTERAIRTRGCPYSSKSRCTGSWTAQVVQR